MLSLHLYLAARAENPAFAAFWFDSMFEFWSSCGDNPKMRKFSAYSLII